MRCIFVLDLLNGAVVHAVRGERNRYEPIDGSSKIVSSSQPLHILHELRPRVVYVADLDRLMGEATIWLSFARFPRRAKTMADIGVSKATDLDRLPAFRQPHPGNGDRLLPSDRGGRPAQEHRSKPRYESRKVLSREASSAAETPHQALQRLNRSAAGGGHPPGAGSGGHISGSGSSVSGRGHGNSEHPLILGGGVKDEDDLRTLEGMGFSGVLVATAVHNGGVPIRWIQ